MSKNIAIKDILNDKEKLKQITKTAFDAVDNDGSGFLELNELENVMKTVAKDVGASEPTTEEVKEIMKELDTNGDQKISLEEFQVLIEQVLEMMVQTQDQQQ
eukprot:TRINITY_DN1399_c0_g1_i3.p1 TRINITY_DN1399_c0_g1~~TRINITY_DN1399_c0_g1_i3.p1  ORF type:complete len:102 (+),score=35.93 TRINITY_DN1399_c0_g1_i3:235-540(+)